MYPANLAKCEPLWELFHHESFLHWAGYIAALSFPKCGFTYTSIRMMRSSIYIYIKTLKGEIRILKTFWAFESVPGFLLSFHTFLFVTTTSFSVTSNH